jgi:hypothetical protein
VESRHAARRPEFLRSAVSELQHARMSRGSFDHHKITLVQPVDDSSSDSGVDLPKLRQNGIAGLFSVDRFLRSQSPGTLSNISMDDRGRLVLERPQNSTPQPRLSRPSWRSYAAASWVKNKGLAYVLAAQVFNCLMNVTIRILEIEGNNGKGFHPLQVRRVSCFSIPAHRCRFCSCGWASPSYWLRRIWPGKAPGTSRWEQEE